MVGYTKPLASVAYHLIRAWIGVLKHTFGMLQCRVLILSTNWYLVLKPIHLSQSKQGRHRVPYSLYFKNKYNPSTTTCQTSLIA